MDYISVKNWKRFQHYKKRRPPWVRLYRDLLNDRAFMCLPDDTKWFLVALWLFASETDNQIPLDEHDLAWRLRCDSGTIAERVETLTMAGFIEVASNPLAPCAQHATQSRVEQSRAETEAETDSANASNPLAAQCF